MISNISGFINADFSNFLPNNFTICKGTLGLCSINLSNSIRRAAINSLPLQLRSSIGNDNSTEIFLEKRNISD